MPIYKQTTEITNIDDLLSSVERDIEEVYFGNKQVFTVWGEYDGNLPATYSANGDYLANYRVYGAAGGVGDETANIYDCADMSYGYQGGRSLNADGTTSINSNWCISSYIEVNPSTAYTINWYVGIPYPSFLCEYDENYNFIGSISEGLNKTFTTSSQTKYLRLSNTYRAVERSRRETCVLVEGSTASAAYVPYGYVIPMSVSDGTTSTTTPIYIGDDPLGEDEYVSFEEQKVHRRTENLHNVATDIKDVLIYPNNGYSQPTVDYDSSDYIPVSAGTYTVSLRNSFNYPRYFRVNFYLSNGELGYKNNLINTSVPGSAYAEYQISIEQSGYIRIGFAKEIHELMFNAGEAIAYQPYLQPTDPPVPLPALPTVDGTTIMSYAGQSIEPSEFYTKYRKQNF